MGPKLPILPLRPGARNTRCARKPARRRTVSNTLKSKRLIGGHLSAPSHSCAISETQRTRRHSGHSGRRCTWRDTAGHVRGLRTQFWFFSTPHQSNHMDADERENKNIRRCLFCVIFSWTRGYNPILGSLIFNRSNLAGEDERAGDVGNRWLSCGHSQLTQMDGK